MNAHEGSALYIGRVMHQRLRPKRHRLSYRVYNLLIDIDELPQLHARLRCFSVDRFNLFSFHAADHGDGSGRDLRAQVEARLREAGLPTGGAIRLLAMPRLLGHVFNPLSVWFCHAPGGALQALLYEVNNTFGQRHSYLIPVADDGAPIVEQHCDKQMYVSPSTAWTCTTGFASRRRVRRSRSASACTTRPAPCSTRGSTANVRP